MKKQITISLDDFKKACDQSSDELMKNMKSGKQNLPAAEMLIHLIFMMFIVQITKILFDDDEKLEIENHE